MHDPRRDLTTSPETIRPNDDASAPAARPLDAFGIERVGDEFVLFDVELNRYHTLNELAFAVWRRCDGDRRVAALAQEMSVRIDVVEAAIQQLGEAGLFLEPEDGFASSMHRRRMLKLVAAGAVGSIGIPVVASITRVGSEASATGNFTCPDGSGCTANAGKCFCYNPSSGGDT